MSAITTNILNKIGRNECSFSNYSESSYWHRWRSASRLKYKHSLLVKVWNKYIANGQHMYWWFVLCRRMLSSIKNTFLFDDSVVESAQAICHQSACETISASRVQRKLTNWIRRWCSRLFFVFQLFARHSCIYLMDSSNYVTFEYIVFWNRWCSFRSDRALRRRQRHVYFWRQSSIDGELCAYTSHMHWQKH